MSAMLLPSQSQYFAVYTVAQRVGAYGQAVWDLHATARDKRTAIEHARQLVLQPNVAEVQVKEITEDSTNGQVKVREIKRCRPRNHQGRMAGCFAGVVLLAVGLIYAFF